jgi:glutamyl-tRNA reductase
VSLLAIGLNHRTAPLDLLERMSVSDAALPKALHDLAGSAHVSEALILSTCNRTEVYASVEKFHGGYHDIREWFGELAFLPPEEYVDHLYVHADTDAASHLFEVAAGLDSAVLGETEILGQVKRAWDQAREHGSAGTVLNLLFRHAVEAGKRVRTETGVSRRITSLSQAAVVLAGEHLGGLDGRRVLVLGAGEIGEGILAALQQSASIELVVANRTYERARELASNAGGTAIRLDQLDDALATVDVMLTSTGAPTLMLEAGDLERVVDRRTSPLLVVDVAVPRDVDPGVADLDGVTLLDMDDLRAFVDAGLDERRRAAARARKVLDAEIERYTGVASAREVAPFIADLHARAEAVRVGELERFANRLAELSPAEREAVDGLTRGIVAKLLHDPTVELKDAAGTPRGERLADALRDLFLPQSPPDGP